MFLIWNVITALTLTQIQKLFGSVANVNSHRLSRRPYPVPAAAKRCGIVEVPLAALVVPGQHPPEAAGVGDGGAEGGPATPVGRTVPVGFAAVVGRHRRVEA